MSQSGLSVMVFLNCMLWITTSTYRIRVEHVEEIERVNATDRFSANVSVNASTVLQIERVDTSEDIAWCDANHAWHHLDSMDFTDDRLQACQGSLLWGDSYVNAECSTKGKLYSDSKAKFGNDHGSLLTPKALTGAVPNPSCQCLSGEFYRTDQGEKTMPSVRLR
eukprot:TRINITY_DN52626_c0_g1_i1.p1 TRINITY_DN52626_c0_g1~~TRINITY_DN52626_c0_g1_i1.p1  ORF type:complete len:165 (+),score=14.56 TRINITY_DN52626_c0_g1_i1:140-634(+)